MKTVVKYVLLFICFGVGVALSILAVDVFMTPYHQGVEVAMPGMVGAMFLLGAFLLFRWKPT